VTAELNAVPMEAFADCFKKIGNDVTIVFKEAKITLNRKNNEFLFSFSHQSGNFIITLRIHRRMIRRLMNWQGLGRKRHCAELRYYYGVFVEELNKTVINLSYESLCPDRYSNQPRPNTRVTVIPTSSVL
jgi:hypothetical protein